MEPNLATLRKEWAADIEAARLEGETVAIERERIVTNIIAILVELEEAEKTGDQKRAVSLFAAAIQLKADMREFVRRESRRALESENLVVKSREDLKNG